MKIKRFSLEAGDCGDGATPGNKNYFNNSWFFREKYL